MIYLVYAHPYPSRSRANGALLAAVRDLPEVDLCPLYQRYPDFDIDVAAEQAALSRAGLVVWMHPLFWYSVPALLKHWFDTVLCYGWAYGDGAAALNGKDCLWVTTTGGGEAAYAADGVHRRAFTDYQPPIEATARFCGMRWQAPFIVHGAGSIPDAELAKRAGELREHLVEWLEQTSRSGAT